MPKYAINYFPVIGLGETARMLLVLADQEYTNNLIGGEEWAKLKTDTKRFPLNQMPTLEVDGKVICQSSAIYRYLANEFGFYGSSNMERCLIDQICETINDLTVAFVKIKYHTDAPDEKKKELYAELFKSAPIQTKFNFMQNSLKENGNGFFVGNKISLADVMFFNTCDLIKQLHAALLDGFDELEVKNQKFGEHDKIKAHIAARKY